MKEWEKIAGARESLTLRDIHGFEILFFVRQACVQKTNRVIKIQHLPVCGRNFSAAWATF